MKTAASHLQTFIDGWEAYNELILGVLRPLAPEQLALKPAPHQWAIWQIASHMAGARMFWFHDCLHEPYAELRDTFRVGHTTVPNLPIADAGWEDDETHPRGAAEIVDALERTWDAIAECLERWAPEDLGVRFERTRRSGKVQSLTREWVIWHLLEHDLHHGGEISSILGSNGLATPDL